jgi:hypothetical protein
MLLSKFEFIKPENHSGFEPKNGEVKVIKQEQFQYIDLGTIIGDAPKCMIALYNYEQDSLIRKRNPKTWKKYIAKSASKWYPNESITEHLLNELGRCLGLNMANSCLKRIDKQIWFLSEYFIRPGYQLYHGADFYALSVNDEDKSFIQEIQDNNKIDDQDYFKIQWIKSIFEKYYPKDAEKLFESFIEMIVFDGIVGNNDRHAYNWGIISSVEDGKPSVFSPIYDTARGLYWNTSESAVKHILSLTDRKGKNPSIEKYVLFSRPKIGWEGEKVLNHIELLVKIYSTETGIRKKKFVNLLSDESLKKCLDVINGDFKSLLSTERRILISKCLTHRFLEINKRINQHT